MSTNTSGWEQWTYTDNGARGGSLTSYHGTRILNGFHAPQTAYYGEHFPYVPDDLFEIRQAGTANGSAVTLLNGFKNLALLETAEGTVISGDPASARAKWTVVLVSSPQVGRQAEKTAVVAESPAFALSTMSNRYIDGPLCQMPPARTAALRPEFGYRFAIRKADASLGTTRGMVIRYGDSVLIYLPMYTGPPLLLPGADGIVNNTSGELSPASAWTIVDPTGVHKAGQRLPAGALICLRAANGQYMSNEPGTVPVRLSPNCSQWEWWKFD